MTVIAWDGKFMAADRCCWHSNVRRRVDGKIRWVRHAKMGDLLCGFSGSLAFIDAAAAAMLSSGTWPKASEFGDEPDRMLCLAVDERRRLWYVNNVGHFARVSEKVWATGGGFEMALGALLAGASAQRAVEIVCRHTDYGGFGIQVVKWG